jgi:hypothetical protein
VVHDRLVIAAHDTGAVPLWQFGQFSEYALACAEATKADAVLLTGALRTPRATAMALAPLTDPQLALVTWLAWPPETRTVISEVAQVILAAGQIAG